MTEDTISLTEWEALQPVDVHDMRHGDRVFTPAAGTVTIGDQPVYGVSIIGWWWTLSFSRTRFCAMRSDGHKWYFKAEECRGTLRVQRDT